MKKEEVPPHSFDFVSQGIPENRKQEDTQSLQKCKTEETVTVKPDSMYWKGQSTVMRSYQKVVRHPFEEKRLQCL